MNNNPVAFSSLLLATLAATPILGAEFSARIVDGLGRPIPGVIVKVGYFQKDAGGEYRSVNLLELRSDERGRVQGEYDEKVLRSGEGENVDLTKEGYHNYGMTGRFQPEYQLLRVYPDAALDQVEALAEAERPGVLRELLAGEGDLEERIFARDHLFRPALRRLVDDPKVGIKAIAILASIGVPEDLQWIARHAPVPSTEGWGDYWAYEVVTSMLAPITEAEWSFLTRCALGEYKDGWVQGGALQSLKLIATVRSRVLLEMLRGKVRGGAEVVAAAIACASANPPRLADHDLVALGKRVAMAIGVPGRQQNEPPRFNERGDKARIALNFVDGNCLFVYTAAFQQVDGVWHLRGVRATSHATLARTIDPEKKDQSK